MCWADTESILQVDPAPALPYLLELIGELPDANNGCPFLVPVTLVQRIQNTLESTYPIHALDASLVASENVLAPRSQETVECFQEALQNVRGRLATYPYNCGHRLWQWMLDVVGAAGAGGNSRNICI